MRALRRPIDFSLQLISSPIFKPDHRCWPRNWRVLNFPPWTLITRRPSLVLTNYEPKFLWIIRRNYTMMNSRALRNKTLSSMAENWRTLCRRHFLLSHHLIDSDIELNRVMANKGVDDGDDDVENMSRSARQRQRQFVRFQLSTDQTLYKNIIIKWTINGAAAKPFMSKQWEGLHSATVGQRGESDASGRLRRKQTAVNVVIAVRGVGDIALRLIWCKLKWNF